MSSLKYSRKSKSGPARLWLAQADPPTVGGPAATDGRAGTGPRRTAGHRPQKPFGLRRFRRPRGRGRARYDEAPNLIGYESPVPVATREIAIPAARRGPGHPLHARRRARAIGAVVYFHGGGFSVGSRLSHDPIARYLASHAGARVLSVEYRRAPEHQFPDPTDDALAAFEYARDHACDLGADPARIAIGGDSAGGNLAAVTAQQAVRRGRGMPAFQLLMYPATDLSTRRPSRDLFAEARPSPTAIFSGRWPTTYQREPI